MIIIYNFNLKTILSNDSIFMDKKNVKEVIRIILTDNLCNDLNIKVYLQNDKVEYENFEIPKNIENKELYLKNLYIKIKKEVRKYLIEVRKVLNYKLKKAINLNFLDIQEKMERQNIYKENFIALFHEEKNNDKIIFKYFYEFNFLELAFSFDFKGKNIKINLDENSNSKIDFKKLKEDFKNRKEVRFDLLFKKTYEE